MPICKMNATNNPARGKNYSEDQYCKIRKKIYFYFNYVDRLTFGYE